MRKLRGEILQVERINSRHQAQRQSKEYEKHFLNIRKEHARILGHQLLFQRICVQFQAPTW